MSPRVSCTVFLVLGLGLAPAGLLEGADPLDDLLEITKGSTEFDILFTDDDPASADYFPLNQAEHARDAVDDGYDVFTGATHDFQAPYVNTLPDFNLSCYDSVNTGGASTGGISLDTPNLRTATECTIRSVTLHEFFHTIEYSYNHNRPTVQKWAREGTSRAMEDKNFSDTDSDPACTLFRGEVNGYIGNPNQDLFALDNPYKSALFWTYAMEQLGNTAGEPQMGVDFVRRFWERVMDTANNSTDDAIDELRQTVSEFAVGKNVADDLDDFFRDFGIANYLHDLDVTALPNPDRYRYIDETAAGGGVTFDPVDRNGVTLSSDGTGWVSRYGNVYYEATIADVGTCSVMGFHGEADETVGWALIGVKSGDRAVTLQKTKGTSFYAAVYQPAADPFVKLAAVVTGLENSSSFDYEFATGGTKPWIVRPTMARQALVGPHGSPGSFIARLRIGGVEELIPEGSPSIKGLSPEEFTATVGGEPATIVTGAYMGGDYWLVIQAPVQAADGLYDLQVVICGQEASSSLSVLYGDYVMNQVVVLDRSGSMDDPTGNRKIDAAKTAAGLFVDASRTGDRLGVVTFKGNLDECDDDSQNIFDLDDVDDAARTSAKTAIAGVIPSGWTSIGDGIERAEGRLDAKATTEYDLRTIVLLSDGMENEGRFWEATSACDGGGTEDAVRPGVMSSGTVIHSIALGPETNQELMQQIAADTMGDYYYVDVTEGGGGGIGAPGGGGVEPSPFNLRLPNGIGYVYAAAADRIRDRQRLFSSAETAPAGTSVEVSIPVVESEIDSAVFFANWDPAAASLQATLYDPAGDEVTEATHPVEIFAAATHKVWQFRKTVAPAGKPWVLSLEAQKAEAEVLVGFSGRPKNRVRLDLFIGQVPGRGPALPRQRFMAGMPVGLAAILTDAKGVIRGAQVKGEIGRPDGLVDEIELLDDGGHDDGAEGDGIYGLVYLRTSRGSLGGVPDDLSGKVPGVRGSSIVSIVGRGESNLGGKFTRYASGAFQVVVDPELNPDSDQDGMPDRWEIARGLDPAKPDADGDPDGDGLRNIDEYRRGTDPRDPDTDDGGENDGSEVKGGRNPLNPGDDRICKIRSFGIVRGVSDSDRDGLRPIARANVLLWSIPLDLCRPAVHIFRSLKRPELFEEIIEVPADNGKESGIYIDRGLEVGVPHYYFLVLEGAGGELSPPSEVVMGIPLVDPLPPEGWVHINCGATRTDSLNVRVGLDLSSKAAGYILSTSPTFAGAEWKALERSPVPFVLEARGPVPGIRTVYCRYRNASGAESLLYSASILFDPSGDFDGDRAINSQDPDDDGDGVSDADEIGKYCTDPYDKDSDDDGIEDGAEIEAGTDPRSSDTDGDGMKDPVDPDPTHPPTGGLRKPGDANADGNLDISDGICLLGSLFLGSARLPCDDQASDQRNIAILDVNGDGALDLSDAVYVFGFLFLGGNPPSRGLDCIPVEGCASQESCLR
jgi:hypothetical protein